MYAGMEPRMNEIGSQIWRNWQIVGCRFVKIFLPVFHVLCMLFIRLISRKQSGSKTYFEVVHYEVMVQGRNVDERRH